MSSALTALGVSFEFANGRQLFESIHLSLSTTNTALVGPNGIGKTCLAKLLAGELVPSSGTIHRPGAVISFAQRESPSTIRVEEYLAEHYTWSIWGERLLEGIARETPCTALSGGQWMRVRLARALTDSFLILDEPTNDLDREAREIVLSFLRQHREGLLLISHDRECLELCTEVLELSNRGLARYGVIWSEYQRQKDHERAGLSANLENAKREREELRAERREQLERQDKRNRRGAEAAARGGIPKILLGGRKRRAQVSTGKVQTATLQRVEQAVSEAYRAYESMKIDPVMYADLLGGELHAQKLVAEAREFNLRYQDWLYPQDLSFVWRGPVRIALLGGNGSGKSSLARALLGADSTSRGQLRRGELRTLYLDQRCEDLREDQTVLENVREDSGKTESELRNGLAKFLFAGDSVFQRVEELSGGERLRVAIARGFLRAQCPEFWILDEPTNNLDLTNIEFLEGLVQQFRGALLVISHDAHFLKNCRLDTELVLKKKS